MPLKVPFRKALITGSTSGLGASLSSVLKTKGVEVIGVARSGGEVQLDLCNQENLPKLFALIDQATPDLIINNAGFGLYGPANGHEIDEELAMIDLNIRTLSAITLYATKKWKESNQTGTVLNIGSLAGFYTFPTFTTYAATKAYVQSFSEGLDEELKNYGIRVLCAQPGQINTPFRNKAARGKPQKEDKRTMDVEDVTRSIWHQLQSGKSTKIIGTLNKLTYGISKCFPKKIINKLLIESIKERY